MPAKTSETPTPAIPVARYFLVFHIVIDLINQGHVFELLKVLDRIQSPRDKTEIDVFLASRGGNVHLAYKAVNVLRAKCTQLQVVVPYWAKSAATLLALGADRIIMGPQSELGPLDIQIEHTTQKDVWISSIDAAQSLENLADTAQEIMTRLTDFIYRGANLPRDKVIELALHFAAEYLAPVVRQCDPALVTQSRRRLAVAEKYGLELLSEYMLRENPDKAKQIAHKLVWNYPSHEMAIGMNEASQLGLAVCPATEYDYWQAAWLIFEFLDRSKVDMIRLFDAQELEEFVGMLSPQSPEGGCQEETTKENSQ